MRGKKEKLWCCVALISFWMLREAGARENVFAAALFLHTIYFSLVYNLT